MNFVKQARISLRLTQKELAAELGVTRQTVGEWEGKGDGEPGDLNRAKLQDLLDKRGRDLSGESQAGEKNRAPQFFNLSVYQQQLTHSLQGLALLQDGLKKFSRSLHNSREREALSQFAAEFKNSLARAQYFNVQLQRDLDYHLLADGSPESDTMREIAAESLNAGDPVLDVPDSGRTHRREKGRAAVLDADASDKSNKPPKPPTTENE